MYKYLLSGFLLIFILNINSVVSQTSGGSAPGGAAPVAPGGGAPTAPSPLDFPQYIIMPGEDLDQFENSRLRRTKTHNRYGQSTLTPKITQKSNVEVNAELEKRRAERQQTADQEKPDAQDNAGSADNTNFNAPGTSTLFRWTDKDGILHVTDDLYSVPPEYRDQAYNSK